MTYEPIKAAILLRDPDDPARRFLEHYAEHQRATQRAADTVDPSELVRVPHGWVCDQGHHFDLPAMPPEIGRCPVCQKTNIHIRIERKE